MDREALERRLIEAGVADTTAVALDATMRPAALDETLPAPAPSMRPRALPRLSIDLRDSIPGVATISTRRWFGFPPVTGWWLRSPAYQR